MRKAFLLIYSDDLGTRSQVKEWADTSPLVINWRFDLPNTIYLISEATATDLSNDLRAKLGEKRHLIMRASTEYWGWLPPDTWKFFRNKPNPGSADKPPETK